MLTNNVEILKRATEGKYGVAAFNFVNMEMLQTIVQAANEEKSPLIACVTEGAIKYMGWSYLKAFIDVIKSDCLVPVAVHLDHGQTPEIIKKCIEIGFTSVMIDASHYSFEENIQKTKEIVDYAHQYNVSVEAELGTIGGVEDNVESKHIIYTDPEVAHEFVEKTGCDTLAVAIGTSHGAYKFTEKTDLNYDILKKIKEKVNVPLVLHGASSIPEDVVTKINKYGGDIKQSCGVDDDSIKKAIENGISKVNTDSDLRLIWTGSVREVFAEKPSEFDLRKLIGPARENLVQYLKKRMQTLGSSGKAWN
jgi:fructose-bisphosphate aldolase, class II